jgi:hypothetical protein
MKIRELMIAATVLGAAACSVEGPEETTEEEPGEVEGVPVQQVESADYMVEGVEIEAVDGADYMVAFDGDTDADGIFDGQEDANN